MLNPLAHKARMDASYWHVHAVISLKPKKHLFILPFCSYFLGLRLSVTGTSFGYVHKLTRERSASFLLQAGSRDFNFLRSFSLAALAAFFSADFGLCTFFCRAVVGWVMLGCAPFSPV